MTLEERMRAIKLFLMDVDGVLTDGQIVYASVDGFDLEVKSFDVKDGLAIVQARRVGLYCGILSARSSEATLRRCRELGIDHVVVGCTDKLNGVLETAKQCNLELAQIAYMGDDLHDLPPMRRVGLAVAPADAAPEVKAVAHFVTKAPGGRGAVREALVALLKAQGLWDEVLRAFGGGEAQ